ncbi:MAG: SAF domain-containing protein [Eubacteriales bacterium]|nr:SAF domain-containing protein [Eubacteriales bacterium]
MKDHSLKKIKSFLGILLILLSLAGLFLWEWKGREMILMEEVLVAGEEIQKGSTVSSSMFLTKGVPKSNLVEGALTPADMELLQGKVSSQLIVRNDQIIMRYFRDNKFHLNRNESIFVLNPSWIAMRSSALRRGDLVDIYDSNGLDLLGTFRVAFVKDASEREVRNAAGELAAIGGYEILDRADSTSVIDHIEIISTVRKYEKLVSFVSGATPAALIIVQRGDCNDS